MNHTPPPFHRCPKDYETTNEERDEDYGDEGEREEGGAGGEEEKEEEEEEEEEEPNGSEESRTQKLNKRLVDQRRVFTIPKLPVLQRSQMQAMPRRIEE